MTPRYVRQRLRVRATLGASIAIALSLAACSGGPVAPTQTSTPAATQPAVAQSPSPARSSAPASPTVVATPAASMQPPSPAPTPAAAPSFAAGLYDEEWAAFTTSWGIDHASTDLPPTVSADTAETIMRERYPGDRPLVWSGLVDMRGDQRVGWMVVLGVAPGQACSLHPGLLERALEGGIVDAATGEIVFTMTCG